jgi:hypothetical protein
MTLTITPINRGTVPNDGTGDTAYDAAGKINDNFTSVADELVANLTASNTYADNLVIGLWDDRGNFDASTNLFPTTGGSGAAGAILKGDIWLISVPATSGALVDYPVGSSVRALSDTPGQTSANWAVKADLGAQIIYGENLLINSNFLVNQRAVSGTVTLAAGAYGHDRWKAGASGCTYTFTTSNGITTLTITAGSLQQIVESSNTPPGINTLALSWIGTAQGKIGGGSFSPSGVTAIITGGSNLTIEFNTGTLTCPKLELNKATPYRHLKIQEELVACKRYYQKYTFTYTVQKSGAGSQFSSNPFPIEFRTVPTITYSGFIDNDGSGCTGLTLNVTAVQIISIILTGTITVGARLFANISLNAEL